MFTLSDSGGLPGGSSTITLTAPPGTVLPSADYTVLASNGHSAAIGGVATRPWPAGGPANNQAVLTLSASTIGPGDTVTIAISGVTNPPSPGDYALIVHTSADPRACRSSSYAITGPGAIPNTLPSVARISLVTITGAGYDPTLVPLSGIAICGLLLDEWPEQIPNRVESTAVCFDYNEPSVRAPQALLLAVNPTKAETWAQREKPDVTWEYGYEVLGTILGEALEAAKCRTVDLTSLVEGGAILPALYLPVNPEGDKTIARVWGQP
jgi:hypothetical protein